jgi:hypothetical protein
MRPAIVALAVWAAVAAPTAADAAVSFRWSVPERLTGDGSASAARSVAAAAAAPPTTIALRSCAPPGARWRLDGDEVRPVPAGRCAHRLDLGDGEPHELALESGGETASETVAARDLLVVSIGDSVASGEGNPDVASAVRPRWLERRCHRSMRSGAAQAALALAAGDPHSSVTFLPLACSGATVAEGLLRPYAGVEPDRRRGELPPQVDEVAELARARRIDALLVSVGANDVHFGPLARFCVFVRGCPARRFDPRRPSREAASPTALSADAVHAEAQRALGGHYDELRRALARAGVEAGRVVAVEYFDPTHDERGETCRALLPGISVGEAEWAHDVVLEPLNAELRNAALRHGWRLVGGVAQSFATHGICARGQLAWVRRIEESLFRGSGVSGPLHPNGAGHLATAALIGPVLANVVGVDPGAGLAQVSGAADDEGGGVAWWWLPLAALGGALAALIGRRLLR